MKQAWADPEFRASQVAKARSPERRAQAAAGARAKWERMTPEERQADMERLHSTVKGGNYITGPEARVAMALNRMGLAYFLHRAMGPWVADLFVPSLSLDIECDGAFWHRAHAERDATRDAWFAEQGYRVIRVPEDADEATIRGLIEGS